MKCRQCGCSDTAWCERRETVMCRDCGKVLVGFRVLAGLMEKAWPMLPEGDFKADVLDVLDAAGHRPHAAK